jgi:hypothetical protein
MVSLFTKFGPKIERFVSHSRTLPVEAREHWSSHRHLYTAMECCLSGCQGALTQFYPLLRVTERRTRVAGGSAESKVSDSAEYGAEPCLRELQGLQTDVERSYIDCAVEVSPGSS